MKISEQGINLLIQREGVRFGAYRDSKGLLTIGVGHLLTRTELSSGAIKIDGMHIHWGHGLSSDLCSRLFRKDLTRFEKAINKLVTAPMEQHQYDALVSFCFNIGCGGFGRSTLLKKLNKEDYSGAENEFPRWRKPRSIISRRAGEHAQFQGSEFIARRNGGFSNV